MEDKTREVRKAMSEYVLITLFLVNLIQMEMNLNRSIMTRLRSCVTVLDTVIDTVMTNKSLRKASEVLKRIRTIL